jgi:hypothetical protein
LVTFLTLLITFDILSVVLEETEGRTEGGRSDAAAPRGGKFVATSLPMRCCTCSVGRPHQRMAGTMGIEKGERQIDEESGETSGRDGEVIMDGR